LLAYVSAMSMSTAPTMPPRRAHANISTDYLQ
jgi:hypothetical protein